MSQKLFVNDLKWFEDISKFGESFIKSYNEESDEGPTRQQDVVATLQRHLSVRFSDVAGTSQMKHPTTSQWKVAKTSQWYVFTTFDWYVVMTSHGNVMTTSLSSSPRRLKQDSNETPNDVSVVRHQDVSVVRLHNVLLVCRDDVSWGRNNDVPSVRLHDVSNKSQMKHPMTSQWYVSTTSH